MTVAQQVLSIEARRWKGGEKGIPLTLEASAWIGKKRHERLPEAIPRPTWDSFESAPTWIRRLLDDQVKEQASNDSVLLLPRPDAGILQVGSLLAADRTIIGDEAKVFRFDGHNLSGTSISGSRIELPLHLLANSGISDPLNSDSAFEFQRVRRLRETVGAERLSRGYAVHEVSAAEIATRSLIVQLHQDVEDPDGISPIILPYIRNAPDALIRQVLHEHRIYLEPALRLISSEFDQFRKRGFSEEAKVNELVHDSLDGQLSIVDQKMRREISASHSLRNAGAIVAGVPVFITLSSLVIDGFLDPSKAIASSVASVVGMVGNAWVNRRNRLKALEGVIPDNLRIIWSVRNAKANSSVASKERDA